MLLVVKLRSVFNPITFVFTYFYGFLFLSQLSVTGVDSPGVLAVSYFLLSIASAFFGAVLAKRKKVISHDLAFRKNKKLLLFLIYVFCVIPVLIVLLMSFYNIINSGYAQYVHKARFEDNEVYVSGSMLTESILSRVSRPLSLVAAIVGSALLFVKKEKHLFYIGVFLLLSFSFIYVKRIDLMGLVVIYLAGVLSIRRENFFREKIKVYISLSLMGVVIFYISVFRASSYSFYELILHYGVGYHTFGFALFDVALSDPSSHLHDLVFPGTTIFSTFDFVLNQLYGILGLKHTPISSYLYANELGQPVFMGYNSFNGREIAPNAFYTSLYPIYRDMKVVGLVLVPFIYGYLFSKEYLTFSYHNNLRSFVWVVFFTWVGYASLLTPVIMGNTFWIIPLFIFLVFRNVTLKS